MIEQTERIAYLREFLYAYNDLKRISRALHRLDEKRCNGFKSELAEKKAEKKAENLLKNAEKLAEPFNLKVFHQSDPRGCSLYLLENAYKIGVDYTQGIAVY